MKKISLIVYLLLFTRVIIAQQNPIIEFTRDTTIRPSKPGNYRLAFMQNGAAYLVPKVGNTIRINGTGGIGSINGFTTSTVNLTSANIPEVTNLYYTNSRVQTLGNTLYPQLGSSYDNPSWINTLSFGKLISKPNTIAGYGITDALSSSNTYSNPSWLTQLHFNKLIGLPTTLSGFGITDAVTTTAFGQHTLNQTNPHNTTKAQVGLANADNTADIDKPISNPTSASLIAKPTSLTAFSQFASYIGNTGVYDGSVWVRVSGSDNTTATIGYGSMCTASVGGFYYRRTVESGVNVKWFGAKGNGSLVTADLNAETAAIKKFIAFVCSQTNAQQYSAFSPYGGYAGIAIFPQGTYAVNDEIPIPGSIAIKLDEGTAHGSAKIVQTASNKHLFHLKPDTDGISSAVTITGGILINGSATVDMTKALIYGGVGSGEANNSSLYIQRVSFRTPQGWCVKIDRGDDIKLLDCTADVISTSLYSFGSSEEAVTNLTISRNTMFDIAQTAVKLVSVRNVSIIDNKIYQVDGNNLNNIFVDATGTISNLTIADNQARNLNTFCILSSTASGVNIHHNNLQNQIGRFLYVTGGNVTYGANVDHNSITSLTSFTSVSPIDIVGSGWQKSIIKDNIFYSLTGNASVPAILANDARTINNQFYPNQFINFPTSYSINSPTSNGYQPVAFGTLASQDASSINVTGGMLSSIAINSANISNANITGAGSYSTTSLVSSNTQQTSDGTYSSPAWSFRDAVTTGMYRSTYYGFRGPVATSNTLPSFMFISSGRSDITLSGLTSSDLAVFNWGQAGAGVWSAYIDGSQEWHLSKQGIGTDFIKGTASSLVLLGALTVNTSNNTIASGTITSTQFKLSALNTAPASATDTGTTGEIRIVNGFIYVCVASNTWQRTALSTW